MKWQLSPFKAPVHPELKIRIHHDLTIQHPDLEKYVTNVQVAERRERIREWESNNKEEYDEIYDEDIFAKKDDENDGEEEDKEGDEEDDEEGGENDGEDDTRKNAEQNKNVESSNKDTQGGNEEIRRN
jgi:hypothetical protein